MIKFNDRMIQILLKKVKFYEWCNELGGCFAYAEVVILVEHFGLKEVHSNTWYNWAKNGLAIGENHTVWIYFEPCKKFINKYIQTKRHDKCQY